MTFNSGVDASGIVLHSVVVGAGIGAVRGLVADVAMQILGSRHGESPGLALDPVAAASSGRNSGKSSTDWLARPDDASLRGNR